VHHWIQSQAPDWRTFRRLRPRYRSPARARVIIAVVE
jgi:hypothetical protein